MVDENTNLYANDYGAGATFIVDTENRKKLLGALIEYMAGDIKWGVFYEKGFKCVNNDDGALMEILYKVLQDRNAICDHYINIIEVDWHYYIQMATFLQSDRSIEKFHYFNPSKSKSETFWVIFWGVIVPAGLYLWSWAISPYMLIYLLMPFMFMVVFLSKYISRSFARKNNFYPEAELSHYWPYSSQEEFEADYKKFETQVNIPMERPDLTGKVPKFHKENYRFITPRPDE